MLIFPHIDTITHTDSSSFQPVWISGVVCSLAAPQVSLDWTECCHLSWNQVWGRSRSSHFAGTAHHSDPFPGPLSGSSEPLWERARKEIMQLSVIFLILWLASITWFPRLSVFYLAIWQSPAQDLHPAQTASVCAHMTGSICPVRLLQLRGWCSVCDTDL